MKAMIHVTKECKNIEEAEQFCDLIKNKLHVFNDVHVNGQITVKFEPSHPEGIADDGSIEKSRS